MFNRRFLLAVLLCAAACLPVPPTASAVTEAQKTPAPSRSKASPSPKKSVSSQSTKKKKKKAKPKPATKKRAAPTSQPERRAEPQPEKKPDSEPVKRLPPGFSTPAPKPAGQGSAIVVEKSGAAEEEPAPTPEPESSHWWWPFGHSEYKYLTPAVRNAIDDAHVTRHRWRYIVVHNSGTRQGNAKAFDYYHRKVRKMPNGLAYHFVIGNGTSSGNGKVEIGPRWARQINGGHVHSDYLNSIALGVCLVGDYNRDKPTPEQLEALDELIRYLRHRVGKTDHQLAIVKAHRDINPPQWPTDCPGDRFPYPWLHSHFD